MSPSAAPENTARPVKPAGLWRRLVALFYDLVAVLAIVMVVGLLCQIATGGQLISSGPRTVIAWWYQPLQLIVVMAYFVVSWLRGGQTLGMRPWYLRLRMAGGGAITAPAALVRALAAAAPLLLLALTPVIGPRAASLVVTATWTLMFAVTLFDRRARALHDIIAGTELVRFTPRSARRDQADAPE